MHSPKTRPHYRTYDLKEYLNIVRLQVAVRPIHKNVVGARGQRATSGNPFPVTGRFAFFFLKALLDYDHGPASRTIDHTHPSKHTQAPILKHAQASPEVRCGRTMSDYDYNEETTTSQNGGGGDASYNVRLETCLII
jgi:hypothetical protein